MPSAPEVRSSDRTIDGPHGSIPIRLYSRSRGSGVAAGNRPGLVWVHGGGFIGGDLDMPEADWVSRQLAERGIAVVSVFYRLSPPLDGSGDGVRFPVASEEGTAAFSWAHAHVDELGADPDRLSLGGASAGANLSAGAALRLRDAAAAQPQTVLLVYPLVHSRLPEFSAELAAKVAADPDSVISAEDIVELNANYLGDAADAAQSPYAFPAGHDLRGLPPTFILNSDIDTLRASGEAYAAELAAAGVDVLVLREDGTHHGHLNEPTLPAAQASIERIAAWLAGGPLTGRRHEPPPAS